MTLSRNIPRIIILLLAFNIFAGIICNEEINIKKKSYSDEIKILNENKIKEIGKNSTTLDKVLSELEYFYNNRNEKEKLHSSKN
jgi:hypothetical protein